MPMVTRNRSGKGATWFVALPEASFKSQAQVVEPLLRDVTGEPWWKSGDAPDRYVVRVRVQKNRHIVHIIDRLSSKEGPMARYRPQYTRISLNASRLAFEKATVVPDWRALKVEASGGWKTIEVYPNPEITVVLE